MVPMQFGLKDALVEESQSWCFKFPQSVVQHHFVALSEICLLNCAAAECNLPEKENIGWRYSTIIQFHVHEHCSQVFPLLLHFSIYSSHVLHMNVISNRCVHGEKLYVQVFLKVVMLLICFVFFKFGFSETAEKPGLFAKSDLQNCLQVTTDYM